MVSSTDPGPCAPNKKPGLRVPPAAARLGEAFGAGFRDEPREPEGPGLGQLLRSLIDDTVALFRHELRLAKTEMTEKISKAARNTASVAIGGAVAAGGALAILAAACTGLWVILVKLGVSNAVAVWLAPLVVGGVVAGVGYAMIRKGLAALRETRMVPEKTAESIKETGRWMHAKVTT